MGYIPLGFRVAAGAVDNITGLNKGKFSNYFSSQVLAVKVPFYEIYAITVTGLVTVQTVTLYVNGQVRSTAKLLGNSEFNPSQPILMSANDEMVLAWDFSAGTAPSATAWLRYDPLTGPAGVF